MEENCLFCKIVEGVIPAQKVFENDSVLGFVDIHPQAKIHLLFIPKKHTKNINDLSLDSENLINVFTAIKTYSEQSGIDQKGFRIVSNLGSLAGQTVFHTHIHVLAGESLGRFGH